MAKKGGSEEAAKGRTITMFFPEDPTQKVVVTFGGIFTGRDIWSAHRILTLNHRVWKNQMIRDASANKTEEISEEYFQDLK